MATASELAIIITAQNETTKALRDIQSDLRRTEERADSFSASLRRIGERAAGFISANVIQRGFGILEQQMVASISRASDLNESLSKTRIVFGDATTEVEKFATGSAHAMGISRQATLEATSTFGNLFTAMRIGQKPAAEMSMTIVKLASDLASFNNTDPAEALMALRSGLVGEIEPLRKYGVNLNAVAIEQRALSLGLIDNVAQLTPATKAQAAYSIILEQTRTAQGDFARTSDGLANSQRTLKAVFEDVQASIGKALLPTITFAAQELAGLGSDFDTTGVERAMLRIQISIVKMLEQAEGAIQPIKDIGKAADDFLNGINEKSQSVARGLNSLLHSATGGLVPLAPGKSQGETFPDQIASSDLTRHLGGGAAPGLTGLAKLRVDLEAALANVGNDMDTTGKKAIQAGNDISDLGAKARTVGDQLGSAFDQLLGQPTQEQARLRLQLDRLEAQGPRQIDLAINGGRATPSITALNDLWQRQYDTQVQSLRNQINQEDAKTRILKDEFVAANHLLLTDQQRDGIARSLITQESNLTSQTGTAADKFKLDLNPALVAAATKLNAFTDALPDLVAIIKGAAVKTAPGGTPSRSGLDYAAAAGMP